MIDDGNGMFIIEPHEDGEVRIELAPSHNLHSFIRLSSDSNHVCLCVSKACVNYSHTNTMLKHKDTYSFISSQIASLGDHSV